MQHLLVSVLDLKVGQYARPFVVPSEGAARRSFADEVNREAPDNIMFHHPEDFVLYALGSFDDVTGEVSNSGSPSLLASASSVKI